MAMEPYPRREKILSCIILNDDVSQKLYLQWQDCKICIQIVSLFALNTFFEEEVTFRI